MKLALLVDLLLPGDEQFPAASAVDLATTVAARLGKAAVSELEAAGADLRAIERDRPELFGALRKAAFISYYENEAVQEVIRSLGHRYNATPLPKGYPVGRFDPARDTPLHGRGHFVPTDEARRVELSALDHLRGGGNG